MSLISKHLRKTTNIKRKTKKEVLDFDISSLPQFKEDESGEHLRQYFAIAKKKEDLKRERLNHKKKVYEKLNKEFNMDYDCVIRKKKRGRGMLAPKQKPTFIRQSGPIDAYIRCFKYLGRKEEEYGVYAKTYKTGKSLIPRLKAWIPDTIVFNDMDQPFWIYSNEKGEVWRTDEFIGKTIVTKIANFSSSNELVAVMKRGSADSNEVKLLTAKELGYEVQSLTTSGSKGTAPLMIQRYIKSIGSKAFVVRTCWFYNRPPSCFIVTNNSSYYNFDGVSDQYKYRTTPEKQGTCSIFKTNKGKHLTDTLPYLQNMVRYLKGALGAKLKTVVCDFVKDESGIWWMINVKRVVTDIHVPRGKLLRLCKGEDYYDMEAAPSEKKLVFHRRRYNNYQKSRACKYCEEFFPVTQLTKKMTLKMIIQMDRHLKHRGWAYEWLNRAEFQYIDTTNLYETHMVCKVCYRLYEEITRLIDIYTKFSKRIGIQMELEKSGNQFVSITTLKRPPQEILELQRISFALEKQLLKGDKSPEQFSVNDNIESHIQRSKRPEKLHRFRMILLIQKIEMIPLNVDRTKNYFLEVHTLDTVIQYKLDMGRLEYHERKDSKGYMLHLNKLSVKYFFAHGRESLRSYIDRYKNLKMYIVSDGRRIGDAEFSLNDFVTDQVPTREFCQNFNGKEIEDPHYYWTWDLKCNIGIHGTNHEVDTTEIELEQYKGLWIPDQYYFNYDTLPETWDKILKNVVNPFTKAYYNRRKEERTTSIKQSENPKIVDIFEHTPSKQKDKDNKPLLSSRDLDETMEIVDNSGDWDDLVEDYGK